MWKYFTLKYLWTVRAGPLNENPRIVYQSRWYPLAALVYSWVKAWTPKGIFTLSNEDFTTEENQDAGL